MKSKKCSKCGTEKPLSGFYKHINGRYGVVACCEECCRKLVNNYHKTKEGLVTKIYSAQKQRSRVNHNPQPTYTRNELRDWLFSQRFFHELYDNWKQSNYSKDLTPSCDRIDDYDYYKLDNIRVITWIENNIKGKEDRKNGINNKGNIAVMCFSLDGAFVAEYYSAAQASRANNSSRGNISSCCAGERPTAGGFIWRYCNDKN